MTSEDTVPPEQAAPEPAEPESPTGGTSALFGRGLLYVAVLCLQLASAVVVSPILAHVLPATEFGQLASAIALNQVLVVLALVGIDQALVLFRAEAGSDAPARSLIPVGFVLAALVTAAALASAPLWSRVVGFPGPTQIVLVSTAWTLPLAAGMLVSALLLGQDRLKAFAVVKIVAGIGGQLIGLGVLAVTGSRSAGVYALGNLVAFSLAAVVGTVLVRPRWRGPTEVALVTRAVALGVPLMMSGLAVFVLNAGDRLVIQRVLGAAEAGRYQIAYTVGDVAVLVLGLVSWAWAPHITAIRDESERWALLGASRDHLIAMMSPIILGLTLGAPVVLRVVAPPHFRPAELLVVVFFVALAGFPVLAGNATSRALITLKRSRPIALSAFVAAVLNVVLNLILLPVLGLTGAAVATVIAFSVQSLIFRVCLPRGVVLPRTPRLVLILAGVSVAASAATLELPQSTAWNLGRFAVAVLCLPWLFRELRRARSGDTLRP